MPEVARSEAREVSALMMIILGAGYLGVGTGWITTTTEGRLAGIAWIPGDFATDTTIGLGWIVVGAAALAAGLLPRCRRLDAVGSGLAFVWPAGLGAVFMIAWLTAHVETGHITAWSYWIWAAFALLAGVWPEVAARRRLARVQRVTGEAAVQGKDDG